MSASANATASAAIARAPTQAYPLEEARERLRGLLPELQRWTPLTGVAPLAAQPRRPEPRLVRRLDPVGQPGAGARGRPGGPPAGAFAEIYLRATARPVAA